MSGYGTRTGDGGTGGSSESALALALLLLAVELVPSTGGVTTTTRGEGGVRDGRAGEPGSTLTVGMDAAAEVEAEVADAEAVFAPGAAVAVEEEEEEEAVVGVLLAAETDSAYARKMANTARQYSACAWSFTLRTPKRVHKSSIVIYPKSMVPASSACSAVWMGAVEADVAAAEAAAAAAAAVSIALAEVEAVEIEVEGSA